MSDPPQSDPAEPLLEAWRDPWQPTPVLRFNRGVLEQQWRSLDSRLEWRAVPTMVYGEAAPQRR